MDLGLRGRVALVCGASSGLGYAVAEQLREEGVTIALNGRRRDRLDAAVRRLRGDGAGVTGFAADVSSAAECASLVDSVHQALGGLDILFCNAGGPPAGAFEDHDEAAWQRALETSLLSTISLCRAAVPRMKAGGWGRVLCLASVAARQPSPSLILSTTARAGVLGFAKALSDEVAAAGITVNVLCPGFFGTARLRELAESRGRSQGQSPDEVLADMGAGVPIGRIGDPKELAAAAVFLSSEPARYITGTVLSVDGGLTRAIV
jgi:3-oxoacyl-[acyl-carrier protein] reductase